MTFNIFADPLEKLHKQRAQLGARLVAARETASSLRGSLVDDKILDEFLDGNESSMGATRRRINEIDAEIADIELASGALVRRIKAVIVERAEKRAAAFQEKANRTREERVKHDARTRQLLDELKAHDGVRYEIPVPQALPPGTIAAGPMAIPTSKGQAIERAARDLEEQAKAIVNAAQSKLRRDHIEDARSLDDLLEVTRDPERLAPLEHAVREWFAEASTRKPEHWAQHNYHDFPQGPTGYVTYRLEWADGRIDPVASKPILNSGPANAAPGPFLSTRRAS